MSIHRYIDRVCGLEILEAWYYIWCMHMLTRTQHRSVYSISNENIYHVCKLTALSSKLTKWLNVPFGYYLVSYFTHHELQCRLCRVVWLPSYIFPLLHLMLLIDTYWTTSIDPEVVILDGNRLIVDWQEWNVCIHTTHCICNKHINYYNAILKMYKHK